MSINPIETTNNIRREYVNYLKSMFVFKNPELRAEAEKVIDQSDNELIKGPYLESTASYKTGLTLRELVKENVLEKGFEKLIPKLGEFPLYLHQQKSIEKNVKEGKNLIVSTGTGSGKTESFLIPILNELVKEDNEGTLNPGVRALILYPMNALANDQLKRLRKILADYPEITFGRYTGQTKKTREEAEEQFYDMFPDEKILNNEKISREEMWVSPPHILLTNYAMLEYLLLRPQDNVFFDGKFSNNWKFIVLDEAHIYSGALGSEISYLIARLKDRVVNGQKGRIRCIATSATLGDKRDYEKIIEYAQALFGEEFHKDSIVEAIREKTDDKKSSNLIKMKIDFYPILLEKVNTLNTEELIEYINSLGVYSRISSLSSKEEVLYYLLIQDYYLYNLKKIVEKDVLLVNNAIKKLFSDNRQKTRDSFFALVNLAARARKSETHESLLPVRYHTFAKAIEGAFISFLPKKKVFINRKEFYELDGKKYRVFELANCLNCGQEYLIGKIQVVDNEEYLVQTSGFNNKGVKLEYFLLSIDGNDTLIDEDSIEGDTENTKKDDIEEFLLCPKCGKLHVYSGNNTCCDSSKLIKIHKIVDGKVSVCHNCGNRSNGGVKRIINADDPTTEVLARTLYQNIPPEDDDETEEKINTSRSEIDISNFLNIESNFNGKGLKDNHSSEVQKGRKLLAFSDSRKDAAYFASYMNTRYNNYLWKNIIYYSLKELMKDEESVSIKELTNSIVNYVKNKKSLLSDNGDIKQEVSSRLFFELMGIEKELGLEGMGMIEVRIPIIEDFEKNKDKLNLFLKHEFNLSVNEYWDIITVFLNSFRKYGAITIPNVISLEEDIFGKYNYDIYFMFDDIKRKKYIKYVKPSKGYSNSRLDYLKKVLSKKGYSKKELEYKANKFLDNFFNDILIDKLLKRRGILQYYLDEKAFKVDHTYLRISIPKSLYKCNKCSSITTINVENVCNKYGCDGDLIKVSDEDEKKDIKREYYTNIYKNIEKIPMKIKEHTAQLETEYAASIQTEFEKGITNILSCSTTFEMGVDVGTLEAVFLRNIPPLTANYIQRAGRAGRRTSSTAYILTYAKRRSHDLYYYQDPEKLIKGKIKAPYIEKNNSKIALRHLFAIVFAEAFRKEENYFKDVSNMFDYDNKGKKDYLPIDDFLRHELGKHPDIILQSINNVFNDNVKNEIGVKNWNWIDDLLSEEKGQLMLSKERWENEIFNINELKKKKFDAGKTSDYLTIMENTFKSKGVIDFLGSNNILPRYGFPIDSVNLDTYSTHSHTRLVDLNRDMKMAISEFAPGNSVMANGYLWKSYSINKAPSKGWPTYEYAICDKCKTVHKEISAIDNKIDKNEVVYCKNETCGQPLKIRKFIKPIFGFSINKAEKIKKATTEKVKSFYNSQVYFYKYEESVNNKKGCCEYFGNKIEYTYSPRGDLFIVNQGENHTGFSVCEVCGYSEPFKLKKDNDLGVKHKNRFGHECSNKYLYKVDLGHEIKTDILEMSIPNMTNNEDYSFYQSVLYAIIEGAVGYMGISRNEIDGVISTNYSLGKKTFVLYDTVPGGAGHVKRIAENIENVLKEAKIRVSGDCGCGLDTSCYGCLRNYSNQLFHDNLKRSYALEFIEALEHNKGAVENDADNTLLTILRGNFEEGYELDSDDEFYTSYFADKENKVAVFNDLQVEEKEVYKMDGWTVFNISDDSLKVYLKENYQWK